MKREETLTTPAQAQGYIRAIGAEPVDANNWSVKRGGVQTTVTLSPAGPNRVRMVVTQVPCVC